MREVEFLMLPELLFSAEEIDEFLRVEAPIKALLVSSLDKKFAMQVLKPHASETNGIL